MQNRIIAIHQPNFLPWLGYFNKIAISDIFVFLDDVAYPKSGNSMGSWTNRVKLRDGDESKWFGLGVQREKGVQLIKDSQWKTYNDKQVLMEKLVHNYSKANFFKEIVDFIEPLIMNNDQTVASYNINTIISLANKLDLECSFRSQSELITEKASTALLIEIVQKAGGDTYLCGGGANGYQDDSLFKTNDIKLEYQNFDHPIYPQMRYSDFVPGLSIIDAIMNVGFEETRKLILMGSK